MAVGVLVTVAFFAFLADAHVLQTLLIHGISGSLELGLHALAVLLCLLKFFVILARHVKGFSFFVRVGVTS